MKPGRIVEENAFRAFNRLLAVVEALADGDPCLETGDMWHSCSLCHVALPVKPADHEPDCPWRMAKEALA